MWDLINFTLTFIAGAIEHFTTGTGCRSIHTTDGAFYHISWVSVLQFNGSDTDWHWSIQSKWNEIVYDDRKVPGV